MAPHAKVDNLNLGNNALTHVDVDLYQNGGIGGFFIEDNPLVSVTYYAGTYQTSAPMPALALPQGQSIQVLDISGRILNLSGSVGLANLDLSRVDYQFMSIDGPNITAVNIKNGFADDGHSLMGNMPNLAYICADENEV